MSWTEFVAAFVAFFLSHSAPVRGPARRWIVGHIGNRAFGLAYAALSLVVLGWLIMAAGRAPYVELWQWEPWQAYVPLIAMLPACLIAVFALARPNPFSFGGANDEAFDPARPGIVRWTRHPLLVALAIWAAAHVVPNGNLAHVILFGSFAIFAAAGQHLVDRRKKRELGASWQDLKDAMQSSPMLVRPMPLNGFALRLGAGIIVFIALIWLHPYLFGVSPLP